MFSSPFGASGGDQGVPGFNGQPGDQKSASMNYDEEPPILEGKLASVILELANQFKPS